MKKKFTSLLCAFAILASLLVVPASAAETFNEDAADASAAQSSTEVYSAPELSKTAPNYDLSSGGTVLGNFETANARSASAITQEFSGYLTEEGTFQYVPLNLGFGQIVHATLRCPESGLLDYDLMLATVDDEGSLNIIDACGLSTYVDPSTGKTVDESLSFIHNQEAIQMYAILVYAVSGSSETYPFNLTVSLDVAGSYDNNEPNDNAFKATMLNLSSSAPFNVNMSGTLNVVNDQDWYMVAVKQNGVYKIEAGDNSVEVYQVYGENALKTVQTAGGNFVLKNNPAASTYSAYYIKVFSNSSAEEFADGAYTLTVTDQSKYASFATAFDLGNWTNINRPRPEAIPSGQTEAYFKFDIGAADKVYARIGRSLNNDYMQMELFDAGLTRIRTANSNNDIFVSATGSKNLILPIDGDKCQGTAYIRVTSEGGSAAAPAIATRLQRMSGSFKSSETATATNTGYSSIINLNLRNTASIPETAVVESVKVTVGYSPSVSGARPGMVYYLRPEGKDWIEESNTLHKFDIGLEDNLKVRSNWQFRVYQTVYLGNITTKYLNLTLDFTWYADIAENNYNLFGVTYG